MSRPRNDIEKVLKRTLPKNGRLVLAISGGKDSIALLYGCAALTELLGLELVVAHVDHALRRQSKSDAEFVKKQSKLLSIKCYQKRLKAKPKKANLEAWAREERYKFFSALLKKLRYDWVVTAHTASDLAETFLMRLVSNKELNTIEPEDKGRKLLRPLLSVSSDEVLAYLKKNRLKFKVDKTNSDISFLRNRVRRVLIPVLEKQFDPRIEETLSERARGLQEDRQGIEKLLDEPCGRVSKASFLSKEWLRLVRGELKAMPDFLSWRFAERLIKPRLGFNLGRTKSKELLRLLSGEVQGVELPSALRLRLKGGGIAIEKLT